MQEFLSGMTAPMREDWDIHSTSLSWTPVPISIGEVGAVDAPSIREVTPKPLRVLMTENRSAWLYLGAVPLAIASTMQGDK
jgi:hypothetical protein